MALTVLIIAAILVATNSVWLPIIIEDGEKNTPTPTEVNAESLTVTFDAILPTSVSQAGAAPTVDPLLESLMEASGIEQLAVGGEPFVVYAGEFTAIDPIHRADGTASIYNIGDTRRVLRLEPFNVTSGPDLHVLLSRHPEPRTSAEALQPLYIDLGPLQYTSEAQNFLIPDDVDITKYQSVVIYSTSTYVIYSTATLLQVRG
jgi:hypothetical protein